MALIVERSEAIVEIRLDRPDKHNALDLECFGILDRATAQIASDRTVRAVLVTASPAKVFCAGADIADLHGIDDAEAVRRAAYRRQVLHRFSQLPVPSVAVVTGAALGGGAELALAATFRLVTANASFAFPEIDLGMLPGAGGTQRLPRLIGEARALEMILSGRRVDAREAVAIGLADRLVEAPAAEARAFVDRWTGQPYEAVAAILAAIRAAHGSLQPGLDREGSELAGLVSSEAAKQRVAAFLSRKSRRDPGQHKERF
jgi:enoyl-CoA hydratase